MRLQGERNGEASKRSELDECERVVSVCDSIAGEREGELVRPRWESRVDRLTGNVSLVWTRTVQLTDVWFQ